MEVVIPQNPSLWGGYFDGLESAKACAASWGNSVTILEPFESERVNEFRKVYYHESPNPAWFEMWCFEQWILMAEWMEKTCHRIVFRCDSDTLIFRNLDAYWGQCSCPHSNHPVPSSFVSIDMCRRYANHIIEMFMDGKAAAISRPKPICDGSILAPYIHAFGAPDLSARNIAEAIDNSIADLYGEPDFEGHKDIWFVNGQPVWVRKQGCSKLVSIHCWGPSKTKVKQIYEQSLKSIGSAPVRLTLNL